MAEMPDPAPRDAGVRRLSTGLRVVLFMSLALNLLIIGLVVGFVLRSGPGPSPRHMRDAVAPYTQALTRADRQALGREIFRGPRAAGSRRESRDKANAEYAEALALLRAGTFDAEAFAEVLSRQSARAIEIQKRGQQALVAHLRAMTPAERQAFAARVADALERRKRR